MKPSLAICISELQRMFIRYSDTSLEQYKLTNGTYRYLIYICKKPGATPGEMAEWFEMDHGHITRCILKLEKLSYIEKRRDKKDRRQVNLYPTKLGTEVFEGIHGFVDDWEATIFQDFTETEKEQLLNLLYKVKDAGAKCTERSSYENFGTDSSRGCNL